MPWPNQPTVQTNAYPTSVQVSCSIILIFVESHNMIVCSAIFFSDRPGSGALRRQGGYILWIRSQAIDFSWRLYGTTTLLKRIHVHCITPGLDDSSDHGFHSTRLVVWRHPCNTW